MKLRPLKPGDEIAFVSPASPIAEEKLQKLSELLTGAGFKTRVMPHALDEDGHLAGTDQDRAADLMAAFTDDSIAAIMCTRGGYGCARLFPFLDLDAMAQSGKAFFGFSDITTLHLALNQRGLPTVHSPMALTLHYDREFWVYEAFMLMLHGDTHLPGSANKGETVVPGQAEGVVTGGCLCLLGDSIGTPNPLDATGKILIIEDVDEAPHRVDAMLTHLLNANVLQSAAGLVFGEMTRSDENVDEGIGGWPWMRIVRDRVESLGIPTIVNYPFGHAKNMLTLPLGIRAHLDATAGTLKYMEPLFDTP